MTERIVRPLRGRSIGLIVDELNLIEQEAGELRERLAIVEERIGTARRLLVSIAQASESPA